MQWEKYSRNMISDRVAVAIDHNVNYHTDAVLGFPGTHPDAEDYYADGSSVITKIPWESSLLDDEPYLRAIIENPNHIGCHTAERSETGFPGTQELEREALAICAEEIMYADRLGYDGYTLNMKRKVRFSERDYFGRRWYLSKATQLQFQRICWISIYYQTKYRKKPVYSTPTDHVFGPVETGSRRDHLSL